MRTPPRLPGIVLCYLTLGVGVVRGLVGRLHGSVEMPCAIQQLPGPIQEINVYWQRKNVPEDLVVATMIDGKVDMKYVNEMYIGRAHLNQEHLQRGHFNLSMTNLSLNDSGDYECIFLWKKIRHRSLNKVKLEVTAAFSTPVVDIPSSEKLLYGQEQTLTCSSQGALEKPRIMWINVNSNKEVQDGHVHQEVHEDGDIINVTSTITLNITTRINVSCVIVTKNGNVTSEPYTMDVTQKEESSPRVLIVSLIIGGGVVVVMLTVILVKWRHTQLQRPRYTQGQTLFHCQDQTLAPLRSGPSSTTRDGPSPTS